MSNKHKTNLDGIPNHPSINRQIVYQELYGRQSACVEITCLNCQEKHWRSVNDLKNQISRYKEFTGLCLKCLRTSGRKANFDLTGIPDHPSIVKEPILQAVNGRKAVFLRVICTNCGNEKLWPLTTLRNYKSNFHGMCNKCWHGGGSKKLFRSSVNPSGKRINSLGYVVLNKNYFSDNELDWYSQMKGKGSFVFEHRWVMAKHLGRPLHPYELVDHKNGDKTENNIDNLRLYIKGKNHPGSSNGYGTYYHEWQMAEKRIRELEEKLSSISYPSTYDETSP